MIADPERFERDNSTLQGAFISYRRFGTFPPICVFAESCSTLGKTANRVGVVE